MGPTVVDLDPVFFGSNRALWHKHVVERFPHQVMVELDEDRMLEAIAFCEEHFGAAYFQSIEVEIDDSDAPKGVSVNTDDFFVPHPKATWDYFAEEFRFERLIDATFFKLGFL